ncbi:MAG: flavodoxin family protein [Coriobacteriales bacterium]|jgi:multimeric flavodoxin WrbA|nr:flavodoxin family protein [Coriobacteriales bacterium]
MKRIVIVDGGPRKTWNTAQMLDKVAEGVLAGASGARPQDAGEDTSHLAETNIGGDVELVRFRLYDLDFKGCVSCFACKRVGVTLTRCALIDDLTPLLDAIASCDGFVVGSPIYLGNVTGLTRAFMERVCFSYLSYDKKPSSFDHPIKTAFVYTANAPEEAYGEIGYWDLFRRNEELFARIFGASSWVLASETLQFDDYGAYASGMFDAAARQKRRETVFPQDLKRAFELGRSLAT